MNKPFFYTVLMFLLALQTGAQDFSIATHASVLRNLNNRQHFTVFGQLVQAQYHLAPKQTLYAAVSYYTEGKFTNSFTATGLTGQASRNYQVTGHYRYRQLSLGWQHYFVGNAFGENGYNIYGVVGFGLMGNRINNEFDQFIDTTAYRLNGPLPGTVNNNRLTLDLGLGIEYPLGGGIYVYGDLRSWLPASSYPSPYLHDAFDFPKTIMVNAGLRILFGGLDD